jgi:hypothetical protein
MNLSELEQAKTLFDQVAHALMGKKWFRDNWLVSVHYFPPEPASPESVTLQVYKSSWFNETRQGIHFEAHLGARELSEKSVPVMMHIFHTTTVPGTKLKRIKVSQPFVDDVFDTVCHWQGYAFRVGKYGTQPFSCKIKYRDDTFAEQLEEELTRLCKELGPSMDRVLQDLLSAPG